MSKSNNQAKYFCSQLSHYVLGFRGFWQISNSILNKDKFVILLLFNGPVMLPSASKKAKLPAEIVSKNFTFDNYGITLPAFPSKTHLKLPSMPIISKFVKSAVKNFTP